MTAVVLKVLTAVRQRRLQSLVVVVVVALVSGLVTLGLSMLALAHNPYDKAFEAQRGAHLVVVYDGSLSGDDISRTGGLINAAATNGPWITTGAVFEKGGLVKYSLTLVGRDDPGGSVEQVRVVAGRWVRGPGEVVITRSMANLRTLHLGDTLGVSGLATRPMLRVVGLAIDVDVVNAEFGTQLAWTTRVQAEQLKRGPALFGHRVAYRFGNPPSQGQLKNSRIQLEANLPPGAVLDSTNYLDVKRVFTVVNSVILSFIVAFAIFALGAAVAIVANLVAGVVISSYREVGIMKAVGFTPVQVVQVFIGLIVLPALLGCVVGLPAGMLMSLPLLNISTGALGLAPEIAFAPGMLLTALVGVMVAVTIATVLPALRAGRLSAIRAITVGSAPEPTRSSWLSRRLVRLNLPNPIRIGASEAWARPLRAALTVIAVVAGISTATFAYGVQSSLAVFNREMTPPSVDAVVLRTLDLSDDDVMGILRSQPETENIVAFAGRPVIVPNVDDPVLSFGTRGDASLLAFHMLRGRWYTGPGEAVAPAGLLKDAGLQVGDRVTITAGGRPIDLQIVGENFDLNGFGHTIYMDSSNWPDSLLVRGFDTYMVQLYPGSDPVAFRKRVHDAAPSQLGVERPGDRTLTAVVVTKYVVFALAAILVLIALAGVFNTVLLSTSERRRDVAIYKAVGMSRHGVVLTFVASATLLGALGGLLGLPLGILLHRDLLHATGDLIGNEIPPVAFAVFQPWLLPLLVPVVLALGIALAALAAILPARRAAGTPVAAVLHSE